MMVKYFKYILHKSQFTITKINHNNIGIVLLHYQVTIIIIILLLISIFTSVNESNNSYQTTRAHI